MRAEPHRTIRLSEKDGNDGRSLQRRKNASNKSSESGLKHVLLHHHGILTLYGVVPNFRYVAQKLVQEIDGIAVIDNQLVVSAPMIGSQAR